MLHLLFVDGPLSGYVCASKAPLLKLTLWLAVLVVNLSRDWEGSRGVGTLLFGDRSRNG